MAWIEQVEKRTERSRTYRHDSDLMQFSCDAVIAPLFYEGEIDSGQFDTAVDCSPERIQNPQLDGWLVTASGWHYALGQPGDKSGDGWVGFGGRQGSHWFKFRLHRVGYLHWPTRGWDDVGGAPDYTRDNLTFTPQETTFATDGQSFNVSARVEWSNLWQTPGGGQVDVAWQLDGDRLKELVTVNQSAREWITTNHPPSTPLSETYFGFVFRLDWSDVPRVVRDGVLQNVDVDFDDGDGTLSIQLQDALERVLALLPISFAYVDGLSVATLRKRFYKSGDEYYLLVGVRIDILQTLPEGSLVFDPTVDRQVPSGPDDGFSDCSSFYNSSANMRIGMYSPSCPHNGFARFTNITVPNSATIVTSYLSLDGYTNESSGNVYADIAADDADDPSAPSNKADHDGRTRTTAYADWTLPAVVEDTWYDTPELASVTQELVNRPGWVSGQAQLYLIDDDSSQTWYGRQFHTYNASAAEAPKLHIEYSSGAVTIEVAKGQLTLTGRQATILVGKIIEAAKGQLTLTGRQATILVGKIIEAAKGQLTLTGRQATINVGAEITINAAKGTLTLTGRQASVVLEALIIQATKGTLTLTGRKATIVVVTRAWYFYIDWDDDGDFDEAIEDISNYVMAANWRLGMRGSWQLVADEAEASLTVKNTDKRFSPENGSSPYAGSLVPQKEMLIQSSYQGVTRTHWKGYVESVQPTPGEHGRQVATVKGVGSKKTLQGTEVFVELQEDVTADTVIEIVIDQVDTDFPRSLETGKTTFSYVADKWPDGIDAYRAVQRLVEAERGRFFLARSGTATFWNRHHLLKQTDADGTVDVWHEMDYRYGEDMINRVGVTCYPRKIGASSETLWEMQGYIRLQPGKSRTFRARFSDGSGGRIAGKELVQPNTGDGSLEYTGGSVVVTDFTSAARSAGITLENQGGGQATVTTLEVRGKKITSWDVQTVFAEDTDSISTYGKREEVFHADLLDSEVQADTVAKYLLGQRKQLFGVVPEITLRNKNATLEAEMITRTIGDRVRVQDNQTGHDSEHYILGERHRLRKALKEHEVTWTLEPADGNKYWILGVSRLEVDTKLAY